MKNEIINNKKQYMILFIIEMMIIIGLLVYLSVKPLYDISFPILNASPKTGVLYETGYDLNNVEGDKLEEDEKIFFNIATPVKKGSYTFRVKYRSSNPSSISLHSDSNDKAIHCDELKLTHVPMEVSGAYGYDYGFDYVPGYSYCSAYFTKDVEDVDIYVKYSGHGAFFIESAELIGNRNYVLPIILFLVFICFTINVLAVMYRVDKLRFRNVVLLICLGLFTSIPVLYKEGSLLHDIDFALYRIEGLAEGLRDGQFPVRIHPITLNGYGYAVSQFYPELFLYPFALLRLIGYSIKFVQGCLVVIVNLITAFIAFYSVNRVYKNNKVAFWGSFIYTFAGYRLIDIYIRGAAGEYLAIMFLPLIVAGIYLVVTENGTIVPLTIGLIGLLNSHLLSCEMAGIFAVLFAVICWKSVFRKPVIINLLKSVVISIMSSAYFIIPFAYISKSDKYMVYEKNAYETSDNMLSFKDFISGDYRISGVIFIFAIIAIIVFLREKDKIDTFKQFKVVTFILGVVALFMTTSLFPWKLIEKSNGVFSSIFCMVQFPWRYIAIATVLLMFTACGAVEYCIKNGKYLRIFIPAIVLSVSFIITSTVLSFVSLRNNQNEKYTFYDYAGITAMSGVSAGEYVPVGFDYENLDRTVEELNQIKYNAAETGITIESFVKSGTKSTTVVANTSDEDRILYLPQTFYRGYTVSNAIDDPNGLNPLLFETENGTIGVVIPKGYYNGVHVEYKESALFRLSELLSVAVLIAFIVISMKKKKVIKERYL